MNDILNRVKGCRVFMLLLVLMCIDAGIVKSQVSFFDGSFEDVLEEARESRKYIYVLWSSPSCAPCQTFEKYILTSDEVGRYYNSRFINWKLTETGVANYRDVLTNWSLLGLPTHIYLDWSGRLVHRSVGGASMEMIVEQTQRFIEDGGRAMDTSYQYYLLRDRFESGQRDPAFLYRFALTTTRAACTYPLTLDGESHDSLWLPASLYFQSQDSLDMFNQPNWYFLNEVLYNCDDQSAGFVVRNKDEYIKRYGLGPVIEFLLRLGERNVHANDLGYDESKVAQTLNLYLSLRGAIDSADEELKNRYWSKSVKVLVAADEWQQSVKVLLDWLGSVEDIDCEEMERRIEPLVLYAGAVLTTRTDSELLHRLEESGCTNATAALMMAYLYVGCGEVEEAERAVLAAKDHGTNTFQRVIKDIERQIDSLRN